MENVTHVYDVNVVTTYYEIEKKLESNQLPAHLTKENYLSGIKYSIQLYCSGKRIDFNQHFIDLRSLVIDSTADGYPYFLGLSLSYIEIPKIQAFLDHNMKKFKGNIYAEKNNFVGLVEFLVYDNVRANTFFNADTRLGEIMRWVREKREKIIDVPEPVLFFELKNSNKKKPYGQVLKFLKNGFVKEDTTTIQVKNIFSTKKSEKIIWIGGPASFHVFIDLLCEVIKKPKNKWQVAHSRFIVTDEQGLILDAGKLKSYNKGISAEKRTLLTSAVSLLEE